MKKVYIETSVISYLAAKPSNNLRVKLNQKDTKDWWKKRQNYACFISYEVLNEIAAGNKEQSTRRQKLCKNVPLLEINDECLKLAEKIVKSGIVPVKAGADALHIATAAVHKIDYLLTWNCKHIANVHIQDRLLVFLNKSGYNKPILCTPSEIEE
jgi:predicted nucleic acid-binding protein